MAPGVPTSLLHREAERNRNANNPAYRKQTAAMRKLGRKERASCVVLLTDFGSDYYVGVMKGVVASIAPGARIIDLAHSVAPGNVNEASYLVESAFEWFPADATFCCVVDPGVGGPRRRLAARIGGGPTFVAPDNGLLSPILRRKDVAVHEITNPNWIFGPPSDTFQGRSHFAPAAAQLAIGAKLPEAGPKVADPIVLRAPRRVVAAGASEGEIVHVDSFGNLVTSLTAACVDATGPREHLEAEVGSARVKGVARTYCDAPPGALLAYIGSTGRLEIAIRDGSAAKRLGAGLGAEVSLRRV